MKKYLWFFFLLPFVHLEAKSVCLNMIVKNESKVIERCLRSVKGCIDYWVIVDTGSTDDTQKNNNRLSKGYSW
jgi:glycosyltransferase involved in cell wall biosynthesis